MFIINAILQMLFALLALIIPVLRLPDNFVSVIDTGIGLFITLLEGASYFIDLNIMIICLTTMLVIDNIGLIFRIGQWVLKLIRG
jgi:hypothetical protein